MKPSRTPVTALLALLTLLLPGLTPLGAQGAEPEEPEIILPEVILRIEDFSVEEVEAVLPEDEELLPRERQIPLPAVGELEVAQPASPLEIGEAREAPEGRPLSILSAQAILGAGTMNHVYSLISLNRVGQEPRFRLRFLNETLDGMAGEPTGSGFDFRQYSLDGEIRVPLGGWTLLGQGLLAEQERGMQRQIPASYASRVAHTAAGDLALEMPFGEHFTLTAGFGAEYTASLLTGPIDGGPAPSSIGELLLSPSLAGTFRIGPVWLGLDARYAYRTMAGGGGVLQRVGLGAVVGVEFLEVYRAEARGGWLYSTAAGHLPPFSLSFSGSPWPVFSFQVSGGYRVDEPSYADVLALFPFAGLPLLLADNHGWFVDGGINLGVGRSIGLSARVRADWSSALPLVSATALNPGGDPQAGLFELVQQEGVGIEPEVGLRWNVGSVLTFGASVLGELGQRSVFEPLVRLRTELEASTPGDSWGGRASLEVGWGYGPAASGISTMPVFDLGAFYRVNEAIVLSVEIDDVLCPLIGGPRSPQPPFAAEGLRGSAFVEINL
ncbi:MAG: hypothetical protein JW820_20945 [Spirochaetales bacterium]|nr:hypothetical protein [Spirochaetales bacterium]